MTDCTTCEMTRKAALWRELAAACVALFAALALASVGGCGSQKGETVMTGGPETENNVGEAPETGTYLLYTAMSPNPTLTVKLQAGDTLGFRKTEGDKIEAVYGDKTHVFGKLTSQVYWKLIRD